ncbi:unnamed protein product [Linum tenue]|uniref:Uncharacterized protein n=1 Tax=Linum tenue TaxID=586396 RepID=A0AAV0LUA3_9ROSI|nr:unnamed protein product [Linum tenue]
MNNTGEPRTKNLRLTFDDSMSMTWKNSSSSLRLGNKVVVRIQSEVARIGAGSEIVVTSGDFGDSTTYEWGETTVRRWRMTRVHRVAVPPMSKVTVRLWGTVGTCEVPFSYVQRDVFGDGEVETYVRDDGFYCGTNCYDFVYETLEESLG